ncbi:dynein regulatory complex subunit 5-like [Macrosteles quadrilineatus]|uniref:dynein regulatory complex subunit 5-like n=1 Tax=Macrosteles quadrilineatus TaxID=74068 RepID=UPI0023E1A53B|nr:dynein regulatory complex subunit 5-like [Macrosteles quadrilineatus]XP_054289862.1 dynein regulatory complex subunit 5-like [Macrosteles quadrilineatus]
MRVPHTVPPNTLKAYEPSTPTLWLVGERARRLRAENWTWDDTIPTSLAEECIRFFVNNFDEHKRVTSMLGEDDLMIFLETLSTELPLEIVIPLIPDGVYWQRRCLNTWATMNDVTRYDGSWKRMFTERYIRDMIETEEPGYTDWVEMGNTLKLCCPFVNRLEISQLQPPRVLQAAPVDPDLCSTEDFIPQHLDLCPVLTILENLHELDLQFGVKGIGMKFTFKCFRIHPKDIEKLANGLKLSGNLQILRISCSDIDDNKLITILKSLEHCKSFKELEIAHCKVTDVGSKALGHFITIKHSLKHLKLQNNLITAEGAQALAFALTMEDSANLETVDLKFNLIGDEGGRHIAAGLSKSKYPEHMILAGCGLRKEAGDDLVDMLRFNDTLVTLDLTNNDLGPDVGKRMADVMRTNRTILKVDVRNCRFKETCEATIHHLTFRNRERLRKKNSKRSDERSVTVMSACPKRATSIIY